MYNTSPIQEKYVYTKDVSAVCCYYTCTALKIFYDKNNILKTLFVKYVLPFEASLGR